ncbi:MAG TPA: hypothetical protein VL860_08350 [Planctomycetota bacterium]|nr:hypothetical protein [Planctomycetota bacterium]
MPNNHLVIHSGLVGDANLFLIKEALESCGMACYIRHDNIGTMISPFRLQYLVLLHEEDLADAKRIVEDFTDDAKAAKAGEPWRCSKCQETCEAAFTSCWNCGTDRDAW